jgi:methyltransferase
MIAKGAVEYDSNGYKFVVLMHTMFFISLIIEKTFIVGENYQLWSFALALFIIAQLLRYWAIASLGEYWNTRIIVLKGSPLIMKGPYRLLKHPNYIAVAIEITVIPLMFSCYFTAIFFSILNIFVLKRRIKIEEEALSLSVN